MKKLLIFLAVYATFAIATVACLIAFESVAIAASVGGFILYLGLHYERKA
jgi:membrane associated rhomboid family serine protease